MLSLRFATTFNNAKNEVKVIATSKSTRSLLSSSISRHYYYFIQNGYNTVSSQTFQTSIIESRYLWCRKINDWKRKFSNHRIDDPTAKRPTSICDPYGQGGKPLDNQEVSSLLQTLDEGWIIERSEANQHSNSESSFKERPISIYKEFYHDDFLAGSQFVSQIAAVGHNNNHFPHLTLERRLMKKEKAWKVVTTVKCMTPPLNGLSYNDFHIAMLIDVETARDEVKKWIKDELVKSV